ncbi:MAG: hypothetical protein ACI3XD_03120 [Oscillospiraceae bacterium]
MFGTILCISILPIILCAFCFVYGLVGCFECQTNGQKMSESKEYRKMFFLAAGSLALLLLLPNPWVMML